MKQVKLTQEKWALIDDDMFDFLNSYKWYFDKGYAVKNFQFSEKKRTRIHMHHLIVGFPLNRKYVVDHIDGNSLDNRAKNLRLISCYDNWKNKEHNRRGNLTGASYDKRRNSWRSVIRHQDRQIHLGEFPTALEAHHEYMKADRLLKIVGVREGEILAPEGETK